MEDLKVSEKYKKAFNHADMICSYMPEELERLAPFENVAPEYKQGFEDRVKQYQIEQDAIKNFSLEELKEKYGEDLDHYGMDQTKAKGMDREMDKEM